MTGTNAMEVLAGKVSELESLLRKATDKINEIDKEIPHVHITLEKNEHVITVSEENRKRITGFLKVQDKQEWDAKKWVPYSYDQIIEKMLDVIEGVESPVVASCEKCGRKTWNQMLIGEKCRMPQVDGSKCDGKIMKEENKI